MPKKGQKHAPESILKMKQQKRDHTGDKNPCFRHGFSKSKFYTTWHNIVQRCFNRNLPQFINYGGRGITCEWKSFEEFKDDMYDSYFLHAQRHGKKETTIDRIDNNGNYSKENCRWATCKEQSNNRR